MNILLASKRSKELTSFVQALQKAVPQGTVACLDTAESVVAFVKTTPPALVVIDESLPEAGPAQFITQLLRCNAFVHTALLSGKTEQELHDSMEGMGLVAFLPLLPNLEQTAALVATVQNLGYVGMKK